MLNAQQIKAFSELTQNTLNTFLVHINRELVPDELLDIEYMPSLLKDTMQRFIFGGGLFECDPEPADDGSLIYNIHEIELGCEVYVGVLSLPENDGFIMVGPYLLETTKEYTLEQILVRYGIPLSQKNAYNVYLNTLPILCHSKIYSVFSAFLCGIYSIELSPDFHGVPISANEAALCPVFEEDTLQIRAETLEKRYVMEEKFLNRLAQGDSSAVDEITFNLFYLERVPNKLRNGKNILIILNTLMRKTLQKAHVHPLYIDAISGKWAVRIEALQNANLLETLSREMVRDYCQMVQRHSLANFTPHVRAMINYVDFNLTDCELSLKKIAEYMGINASYLSQHFNREVGCSLPEYITHKRILQAKHLLLNNTDLNINQVAGAVGFSDMNYFTKVFKKETGYTPSVFRKL